MFVAFACTHCGRRKANTRHASFLLVVVVARVAIFSKTCNAGVWFHSDSVPPISLLVQQCDLPPFGTPGIVVEVVIVVVVVVVVSMMILAAVLLVFLADKGQYDKATRGK